jgi:hypothetical protein
MAVDLPSLDEIGLDRSSRRSGPEEANAHGAVPRLNAEAELSRALSYRVPVVVIDLDGRPVVAPGESGISGSTESSRVVADRRLGDVELGRDRGDAHSALKPLGHQLTHDPRRMLWPRSAVVAFRTHGLCSGTSTAGSSNGKTPVSGTGYRGSSPCPAASSAIRNHIGRVRCKSGRYAGFLLSSQACNTPAHYRSRRPALRSERAQVRVQVGQRGRVRPRPLRDEAAGVLEVVRAAHRQRGRYPSVVEVEGAEVGLFH